MQLTTGQNDTTTGPSHDNMLQHKKPQARHSELHVTKEKIVNSSHRSSPHQITYRNMAKQKV